MNATEMKAKVVEAKEQLRIVLSEISQEEEGLSRDKKHYIENEIEDVIATLTLIILARDFAEKRNRDEEAGYVKAENSNL